MNIPIGLNTTKIQTCIVCDQPTEKCKEDSLFDSVGTGPLCPECFDYLEDRPPIDSNDK